MVEFSLQHNASSQHLADYKANALAVAAAYRLASDDDTRAVMNMLSTSGADQSCTLNFYLINASWFRSAYAVLTCHNPDLIPETWRESLGIIENEILCAATSTKKGGGAVRIEDEDEKKMDSGSTATSRPPGSPQEVQKRRFEQLHRARSGGSSSSTTVSMKAVSLRVGIKHEVDYFCIGPSAWMLLVEKFGFDGYELVRPCIKTSHNTIAVEVVSASSQSAGVFVEIPGSGRFPYEQVMSSSDYGDPKQQATTNQQQHSVHNNGDDLDGGGFLAAPMDDDVQQPSSANATKSTLVPEDDEPESNDISWEASKSWDKHDDTQLDEAPIIRLPPSATNPNEAATSVNGEDMDIDCQQQALQSRKRLASGLCNLGNTCFMNSTLQCLAHTDPLRKYFLSGDYLGDLNKDNPLGTGGELAKEFASLMAEIWGIPAKRRNVMGAHTSSFSHYSSSAVYPKEFKGCLGRHAEQFVGYDQHDSQELATYLLDALHEDTNRVTKKPYVEKPEQGENEQDHEAAEKAWSLHLQREDSQVLENFMGQVKSRLECSEAGCNRVSTTFDPFMYLSVPIPGATDRKLKVTFVPIDGKKRARTLTLTLNKNGDIEEMLTVMNEELVRLEIVPAEIPLENLAAVDVWKHQLFGWHDTLSFEIDRIRDTDQTFVYELAPLQEIREASKAAPEDTSSEINLVENTRQKKLRLDLATITRLNRDNAWQKEVELYLQNSHFAWSLFARNRGTVEEKVIFHRKLELFINQCYADIEPSDQVSINKSMTDSDDDSSTEALTSPRDQTVQGLVDRSETSKTFKNVRSINDVAILEFITGQLRKFITDLFKQKKSSLEDGVLIQVALRKEKTTYGNSSDFFGTPIILRVPSTMTVYGLRKELFARLERALNCDTEHSPSSDARAVNSFFGAGDLSIIGQLPLMYEKASTHTNRNMFHAKKLGMIGAAGDVDENGKTVQLAIASNHEEKQLIAELVGKKGSVAMDWTGEQFTTWIKPAELEPEEETTSSDSQGDTQATTSVLDCIHKYCQKEQLEESEKWYCNRCKDHVRAWKQFHLYRAPPILIVHLKRFHFSSTTHRRDKITSYIDFPLNGLDLTSLVSHYNEAEKPLYECYAVSNHYGGLGGGHYTAYILNDEGKWCHYDDSRVTEDIAIEEVKSAAAYVLYYRRQDVLFGKDVVQTPLAPFVVDYIPSIDEKEPSEISSNVSARVGDDPMPIDDRSTVSNAGSFNCSDDNIKSLTDCFPSPDDPPPSFDSPRRPFPQQ